MAFSSTITERPKSIGHMRMSHGSFSDDAGGGNINTGLRKCHSMMVTASGSAMTDKAPVVNETYPCTGTAVTIICNTNATGYWIAFGY